jgi:hypothetical protein
VLWDPDQIDDDVLALVFTSCHPVLSREARVALTLRVIGGLTSDEIAKAFLAPTATVQARITRAKKTLTAARVPFEVPPAGERAGRLGSVLSVIYLIFTEGSSASSGDHLVRLGLASEAQRLARVLSRLMPAEPEVHGLLALLELTAARFPARTGPDGQPVLPEDQDRGRWDQAAIGRGEGGHVEFRRGPEPAGPGVVDEHVDRGGLLSQVAELDGVAEVGGGEAGLAALGGDGVDHGLAAARVASVHDDLGAMPGQLLGHRLAYAGGRAGDQCAHAFKIPLLGRHGPIVPGQVPNGVSDT